MNVPEVADYMRISERKIREMIAVEELESVRIGRRVILLKVDIDELMAEQVV